MTQHAALLERLAKAESERDTARAEVDAWKDASGLERGGSPEHVGPDHLRADLKKRDDEAWALRRLADQRLAERNATESEAEALRERVATLEREVHGTDSLNPGAVGYLAMEKERADAAEARVKELTVRVEGAFAALSQPACYPGDVRLACSFLADKPVDEMPQVRFGASQPPPAPAQVVMERIGMPTLATADARTRALHRALFDASEAGVDVRSAVAELNALETTPTPPALVDAVGTLLSLHDATTPLTQREWFGTWGAVRAAYDAAKGGGR